MTAAQPLEPAHERQSGKTHRMFSSGHPRVAIRTEFFIPIHSVDSVASLNRALGDASLQMHNRLTHSLRKSSR